MAWSFLPESRRYLSVRLGIHGLVGLLVLVLQSPSARSDAPILRDDFQQPELSDRWDIRLPTWQIRDGGLFGCEDPNQGHGAVIQSNLDFDDLTLEFDFRLEGSSRFNVVIDDQGHHGSHAGHICRISVSQRAIELRDDKTGAMENSIFALRRDPSTKALAAPKLIGKSLRVPVALKQQQWYKLRMSIAGERMTAWLDGRWLGTFSSAGIGHPTKTDFGFTVPGKGVVFDHVVAWKPSIPPRTPPNVLFISIDDLNDWVGCLEGHPQIQTPNIDALAARGANFTNAHCQAPICNPSRISMLLGQLPSTTGHYFLSPGFRDVESTANAETLFQFFRKHGYFLSTRGKIFHGKPDRASFDEIQAASGWRRPRQKLRYKPAGSHPLWDWGQVDVRDEEMRDHQTAVWAARRLPQLAADSRPYFLAVGFSLPHVPLYTSKRWMDLYPLEKVELPAMLSSDRDDIPEYGQQLSLNPTAPRHRWMVEHDEARHAVRAYLASTSFVDHLVGIVLEGLAKSGESENTLVVLWSDHGFHLGEKLKWAKRSLWEESTRIPLILAGPNISPATISAPVGLIDVYPTLSALCGLPRQDHLDGRSLGPLLDNPQTPWDQPAICTFGRNNHSIRSEYFHYIVYDDGSEELYDHRSDRHEWTNLAGLESYRKTLDELRQWIPDVNAPAVPGSRGSDSPIYGEAQGLQATMPKK